MFSHKTTKKQSSVNISDVSSNTCMIMCMDDRQNVLCMTFCL